jgi:hypothetical protein
MASSAKESKATQGKKLSKQEYIWLASGVCLKECVGERELGLPPLADPLKATDADMPGAAKYGDGLIPILQRRQVALKALGLPDLVYDLEVLKEALRQDAIKLACFIKANDAAHRGNSAEFRRQWLRGRQADLVAVPLFKDFGLPLCAAD